jgi:hypothetical protein
VSDDGNRGNAFLVIMGVLGVVLMALFSFAAAGATALFLLVAYRLFSMLSGA